MRTHMRFAGFAAAAILAFASAPASSQNNNWVAAWSTSQQGLAPQAKISNASVRMIARVECGEATRTIPTENNPARGRQESSSIPIGVSGSGMQIIVKRDGGSRKRRREEGQSATLWP